MTRQDETGQPKPTNWWRIARWSGAALLLLLPAVMMQLSDEWNWNIGSFLLLGTILGITGLLYEWAERTFPWRSYRMACALAMFTGVATLWTTIVHDSGDGLPHLLVVLAAGAGAFAAWFRPAAMARAMLGTAAIRLSLGLGEVTAPVIQATPGAVRHAMLGLVVFTTLWLASGALFWLAARAEKSMPAARK